MALNDGLKKYSDHNKAVKLAGGVDNYNAQKVAEGTGNKIANYVGGIMIGYLCRDLIVKGIHKIGDKIDERRKRKEEIAKKLNESNIVNDEELEDTETSENIVKGE